MNGYVLDTSVAVAWYLPESFAGPARRWQQQLLAGQIELVVPGLHYWEFANVLRTYVRRGELDESLAHEVNAAHVEAPLIRAEPDHRPVFACALEHGATVYDAVYIQLALERDLKLLTAERSTAPWIQKLGDRIVAVR